MYFYTISFLFFTLAVLHAPNTKLWKTINCVDKLMLLSKEWERFLVNWMRIILTTRLLLREEMYSMAEKECLAVKLVIYVGLRKTVYIANRPSGTTVAGLGKESSV